VFLKKIILNLVFSLFFIDFYSPNFAKQNLPNGVDSDSVNEEFFYQKEEYIVGPGDIIRIRFLYAPELSGDYEIMSNGSLPLPLVGNIDIRYLEFNQLEKLLYKEFSKKVLKADLNIVLVTDRARSISVIGEVNKPGLYTFTTDGAGIEGIHPRVIDVLNQAGGVTTYSNLREVKIIRRLPGKNQEKKVATIDLVDLILEGDQSQNIYLEDGDIISLSKANSEDLEFTELSSTNLYPDQISVNIIGAVNAPGSTIIQSNTPLIQAIMQAGGPRQWRTNKGNVELIRVNKNGTAFRKRYRIDLLNAVSDESNPILQNGDLVKVNPSLLDNVTTGLTAITEPFQGIVNAITLIKLIE
tara:strand:+ start:899 stop:1963 length:1065 start_codon:yes stop_codon:yes gene_type:complete